MTKMTEMTEMTEMTTTPKPHLALLHEFEGLRQESYLCPAGIWTIGYGHTGEDVGPDMQITRQKAEYLLRQDVKHFEEGIRQLITVPLNPNQFSALVCWAFNVGLAAVERSTLRRLLNQGHYDSVPAQLARWNKSRGQVLRGLTRRRAAEAALFLTPHCAEATEKQKQEPLMADTPPDLRKSRTLIGVGIAGFASICEEIAHQLKPLISYGEALKLLFLIITLCGIALAAYARIDATRKGKIG